MRPGCFILILLCLMATATAQAQDIPLPDWSGTWQGDLTNLPLRPNAPQVDVTMELGPFPTQDSTCTMWRTTYAEAGVVRQVKDYQLCRGTGADDLYIDEGDDIILTTRWLGDVLVTPFKYDTILLITRMQVRGDVMEQEILTAADEPAVEGVLPLVPRGIQRLTLRRVTAETH